MGVIDILPSCVSSVYFMWEKEYEKFSLGKVGHMEHRVLVVSELETPLSSVPCGKSRWRKSSTMLGSHS